MKATLSNYRQSPRKVRLVADLVRGKSVQEALTILTHTPNRAAAQMAKLIKSAVANAGGDSDGLAIKEVRVDGGITLKRVRPRARGSAFLIRKRTSHVALSLGEQTKDKKSNSKDKKEEPKEMKKK